MVKKYKFHNVIEIIQDYIKPPTNENGCIKDQYETESKTWESNPAFRCPKCHNRALWLVITYNFKDLPIFKLKCANCGFKEEDPFECVMSFASDDYPKKKKDDK